MPPFRYRLTKYDPALRDERGAFTGDDWTSISDIGGTFGGARLTLPRYLDSEARHLIAVASFIEESNVTALTALGVEGPDERFPIREGERLSPREAVDIVRVMLREEDGWCRLEDSDRFYVHIGFDYYVFVGSWRPCETSVELATRLGLFVDHDFTSPHDCASDA